MVFVANKRGSMLLFGGVEMVSRLYFLIAPNDDFRTRLASYTSDVAGLLKETRLWAASHTDRSNWSVASRTVAVKLLYLAHIRQDYSDCEEYANILGSSPLTADTFDKWLTATPLQVDEDFEDVSSRLDPAVLIQIAKTGIHAVDEWIDELGTLNTD